MLCPLQVLGVSIAGADGRDALIACIRGSVDTGDSSSDAKKEKVERLRASVSIVRKGGTDTGAATSTSFWTDSRASPSATPPGMRRVQWSTSCP